MANNPRPVANGAPQNEKPKTKGAAQVVQFHALDTTDYDQNLRRLAPASGMSVVFHLVLLGLFALLAPRGIQAVETEAKEESQITTETQDEVRKDPLLTTDVDPAATEFDVDINYNVDRRAEVSVPGTVNENEAVGILNGDKDAPPTNIPAPGGFGNKGQGGALEGLIGNTNSSVGEVGGYGMRGVPLAGSFYGRSGATREKSLREGGGTGASEAAVAKGLGWLARMQEPDGRWKLDGKFPDKGNANDAAGTALGLLPFLGAGKTHKITKDNPYDKGIAKALDYLIAIQDKKTGAFNRDMYAHGLCTIAICEAFGLSQDYNLRKPAQEAIKFIVSAQHSAGGWRYSPGAVGDTSVTGWQIMALKSGLMAGLDVPPATLRKAQSYLENQVLHKETEGYGYLEGVNATPTLTAVALLCRQYLQGWGPQNLRMIKAVDTYIKPNYPKAEMKNSYYYYYATQVMHHFGGDDWKAWNLKNRELLVKTQNDDRTRPEVWGSWSPQGDQWGQAGGRLMVTSLNLLSLEVYYRYLPLYYRDNGGRNDQNVGKGL
jgi:hypothetical protein